MANGGAKRGRHSGRRKASDLVLHVVIPAPLKRALDREANERRISLATLVTDIVSDRVAVAVMRRIKDEGAQTNAIVAHPSRAA